MRSLRFSILAGRRLLLAALYFFVQNVPSIARVAAGAFGFLTLIEFFDGPERYGEFIYPHTDFYYRSTPPWQSPIPNGTPGNRTLFLKTTRSQYGSPFNVENDYVVLHDGQVIGRIILPPPAQGCPWFWTITAREKPPSIHNRGYSVTREQAMKDFKTQWLTEIQR